jgi:FkbM family methyltransferase
MIDTETISQILRGDEKLVEGLIEHLYRHSINDNAIVIDVGAHTGRHTIPMADTVPNGMVIAVEAMKDYADRLRTRLDELGKTNVRLEFAAVQNDPAKLTAEFEFIPERPGRSSIISATKDSPVNGQVQAFKVEMKTVPASTLDRITIQQSVEPKNVRFIKLDIEGGEFRALQGAMRILQEGRPIIAMESAIRAPETYGYTLEEYFEFFKSINYTVLDIIGNEVDAQLIRRFNTVVPCPNEYLDPVKDLLSVGTQSIHRDQLVEKMRSLTK